MSTEELIEIFLKNTPYQNNDNVLVILAYGSRIYGTAHEKSDLDILMLTNSFSSFRGRETINGIVIDYFLIPVQVFENRIRLANSLGDAYPKSILNHGRVLKNRFNMVESLQNILNQFSISAKISLNAAIITDALDELEHFESGEEQVLSYYTCLERLRQLAHAKMKWSNLPMKKVYDLYTNSSYAKKFYELKMPDNHFISFYLEALKEEKTGEKRDILYTLLEKIEVNRDMRYGYFKVPYSKGQIMSHIISLHNHIEVEENYLLQEHPYAIPYYFLLVKEMWDLNERMNLFPSKEFVDIYQFAKNAKTIDERIQALEAIFAELSQFYKIDYNRFLLKLDN